MEIIRASTLGFCGGVRRAIILTEQEKKTNPQKKIETIGPIIHNEKEIDRLEKMGITTVPTSSDVGNDSIAVIRAHGATFDDYEILKSKKVKIIEGVCPLVRDSRTKIINYSKEGFFIILTGEPNHSEVKGLISFAKEGVIVDTIEKAKSITTPKKSILISQSTWRPEYFKEVSQILKSKNPDLIIENTICSATLDRQKALRDILDKVDCLIVVGSSSSSNTRELYNIAVEKGIPCWLSQSKEEIPQEITQYEKIGLTAGASAPDWLINEIEERVFFLFETKNI